MSLPLHFHPNVRAEVDEAHAYYERQRPGLGDEFLLCVEDVLDRIGNLPKKHSVVYMGVRRALLRRFPYGVFYRVEADRIEVIAVQHSRRDPADWKARIS